LHFAIDYALTDPKARERTTSTLPGAMDDEQLRPWVRNELPWLSSGPLFRVHVEAVGELERFLARSEYVRFDLDGGNLGSLADAHRELARLFAFPSYYGHNWDAFADCIDDVIAHSDGRPVAVVWHHIDQADPATVAELGWALLDSSLDVFAIGNDPSFDRPTGADSPSTD
jgi:RNAse (barnase) inhibitor barstar